MVVDVKPVLAAGFGVKGLKTWNTDDGGGYQFNLTFGGKVVAEVTNGGYGGPTDIRWEGEYPNGTLVAETTAKAKAAQKLAQQAKVKFDALVEATPPMNFHGTDLKVEAGTLLEELLNEVEAMKQKVRLCKGKTVFRIPSNQKSYYIVKEPYTPEARARVLARHPDATFVNDELAAA